ncbi:MAG: hypothetical protein WDM77_10275 [Steroidobacteraceae bacterium]
MGLRQESQHWAGGQHIIVPSPHHFPQLMSDEFNTILEAFMTGADARDRKPRIAL